MFVNSAWMCENDLRGMPEISSSSWTELTDSTKKSWILICTADLCEKHINMTENKLFFFLKGEDVWMKADKQTEASTVAAAAAALRNKTALFKTKHSGPLSWSPLPFQPSPSGADPAELTINITWIINYPLLFLWLVFLET